METEVVEVGTFKITSGKMRITDPAYERDAWASGVLENVACGSWRVWITKGQSSLGGPFNVVTRIRAECVDACPSPGAVFSPQKFSVGVDTAQVIFADDTQFPAEVGDYQSGGFYTMCCELSERAPAHTFPGGVVVQSGWGDGVYVCETLSQDDNKIIGVQIVFVSEDEDKSKETEIAPSVRLFEELAEKNPSKLIDWLLRGTLSAADLTFAAEAAGEIATPEACAALFILVQHKDPVVREGAVYGLAKRIDYPGVLAVLCKVAKTDESPGVQRAATDALSEYGELLALLHQS